MSFCVDLISTRRDLDRIQNDWIDLHASSDAPSVFLTWDWVQAWLTSVNPDAQLHVLGARDPDGLLVAVAPFYVGRFRAFGTASFRCLRMLGDTDSGSEYPDVIVRRGTPSSVFEHLGEALNYRADRWDWIWLPNAAAWSGASERLAAVADASGSLGRERRAEFAPVALPDSYADYLSQRSGNLRSMLRRQNRRLGSCSQVEFMRCETRDDLTEMLRCLYRLHALRWARLGKEGCFERQPRMRAFYDEFAPRALSRAWLRCYALRVNGAVRAVQIGYAYGDAYCQLQEGFDPNESVGLGNVLRGHVIENCIREGLREYDFLGEFTEHKRRWGAKLRTGRHIFRVAPTLRNRIAFAAGVWPTGRYLRQCPAAPGSTAGNDRTKSLPPAWSRSGCE